MEKKEIRECERGRGAQTKEKWLLEEKKVSQTQGLNYGVRGESAKGERVCVCVGERGERRERKRERERERKREKERIH